MAFKSEEEIQAAAQERLVLQVENAEVDQGKREEFSKKRIVITLDNAPIERFAGSQKVISFFGKEDGRSSSLSGVYFVPEHESRDGFARGDFDARIEALRPGDKLSMAGRWSKRKWEDNGVEREGWEFRVQNFAKGDVSIADMQMEACARIGDARLETLPMGEEISQSQNGRPQASPLVSYASGDIVDDRAEVLVNTVNSQLSEFGNPVMGKGVALAFKNRFPSIMNDYGAAIRSGELRPGRALLFDLPDGRKWAALATKDHFRDQSQMEWVDAGLKELGEKLRAAGISSVALPPPGCGNGGLNWKEVEPLVHKHLAGISVSLYAKPSGAMEPAAQIDAPRQNAEHQIDSGKARTLAAFGSAPERSGAPREWTKEELLKAIPSLLRARDGYNPYAGIGSRETPQDVSDDMTAVARVLEGRGFTLRSGFAGGADTAFELGTTRDDLREIFAPWKGFGANPNSPHEKVRWDQIRRHEQITGEKFTIAKPTMLEGAMFKKAEDLAKPHHPTWDRLGDGPRKMHTRNMGQVFGPTLDVPARFELAYTIDGKATGGTGQAIRVAQSVGIPVLNMHDPDIRAAVLAELGISQERAQHREWEASMTRAISDDMPRSASPGEFDLGTPPIRSRHKDDVASFCKVADPLGSLSNMYNRAPIVVDGVTWKSSEALYQALRFPDHPELQEAIRNESNAYTAKVLAHENKHLTRPDWNEVNHQAMAWVITLKEAQSEVFRKDLASTEGRDIVELSVKDDHWGAKPKGDQLVGHDVLGFQLTQLRDGARMHEPPEGSRLLGRDIGVSRPVEQDADIKLPDPALKASMYFEYGKNRREGFKSETTFDAILAGERTSTTRYKEWGLTERWEKLEPGSVVRFYEDKNMRGRSVDVVVLGTEKISLRDMDDKGLEEWSKVEGWSVEHARASAKRYSEGVQIRYALPESPEGQAALGRNAGEGRSSKQEMVREAPAPAQQSQPRAMQPAAQRAAMSAKERTLSLFG